MAQKQVFGLYKISHLFVVGRTIIDTFLPKKQQQNSRHFDSSMISQHFRLELLQCLEQKQIYIPLSVLLSTSISDISQPITREQLLEYIDRRHLHQVASEDYMIDFEIHVAVQEDTVDSIRNRIKIMVLVIQSM